MSAAIANGTEWCVWIDNENRIISFHEEEGFRPVQFLSHEMFLSCVDAYTGQHYRYQ